MYLISLINIIYFIKLLLLIIYHIKYLIAYEENVLFYQLFVVTKFKAL